MCLYLLLLLVTWLGSFPILGVCSHAASLGRPSLTRPCKAGLLAPWVSISECINSLSFTAFGTIYTYLVWDSIVFLYCLPLPRQFHEESNFVWIIYHCSSSTQDTDAQPLFVGSSKSRLAGASPPIRGLVGVKAWQGIPAEEGRRGTPQCRQASSTTHFSHARLLPCALLSLQAYSRPSPYFLSVFLPRSRNTSPAPWVMLKLTSVVSWLMDTSICFAG